jgi:hypothetical protein
MALYIQSALECGLAADDYHRDVDQPQDTQHEDGLLLLIDVPNHLPQFDEKLVRVQQLGHDQAAVVWGLNTPTANKTVSNRCSMRLTGKWACFIAVGSEGSE